MSDFQRPPVGQRQSSTKPPFGTHRKPLGRPKKSRHIRQGDYLRLVGVSKALQGGRCVGLLAGIEHECDDFQFLHFVDQQQIVKILGEGHPALTDERLGAYGCQWMNNSLDEWRGPLREIEARNRVRAEAHPEFEAALAEYGLENAADRKFDGA